jgi:hypothetical protein
MTVTQSYSLSLTYTSLRMYLPQTTPAASPASSEHKPTASASDTVTLSPEATSPPVEETPASQPAGSVSRTMASPDAPAAAASRASRRAEVLLDALDADQDAAITKEEFVEGAIALLRRAGARHHHRRCGDVGNSRLSGRQRRGCSGAPDPRASPVTAHLTATTRTSADSTLGTRLCWWSRPRSSQTEPADSRTQARAGASNTSEQQSNILIW